jgi:hypothetical protein
MASAQESNPNLFDDFLFKGVFHKLEYKGKMGKVI